MMSRLSKICSIDQCVKYVWSRDMCRMHYYRWRTHGDPRMVLTKQSPFGAPSAFLDNIPIIGTGCITWPYCKNNVGYAQINIGSKKHLVSRIICERAHGSPPTPLHVAAHECGNGHLSCVAPWHLRWKTPAENNLDMDTHGTRQRGEIHKSSKISLDDVLLIRQLAGSVSQSKLGEQFGICQVAISLIVRRKNWRHVP